MRFLLIFLFIFLQATNLSQTKKALNHTKYTIKKMNLKLDSLAKAIINTQKKLNNINKKISSLNIQIGTLQNSLKNSSKTLNELNDLKKGLLEKQKNINNEITSFISQNYYIDSKKINTLNDLIYTSLTLKILKKYSKKINNLIKENRDIQKNINMINKQISDISAKKKELEQKKQKLLVLKKTQLKILFSLKKQKKLYWTKLQNMFKKQKFLQKKLAELKIIKKTRIIPEKIPLNTNIEISKPLNVKKVGSAYFRPKLTRYRGPKTIPPVKGRIIKKFGSYIDPIYKIKIYNDSITIKTQPNSLVRTIFPGKVIYVGKDGDKKIIFIKHKGNLFSIYANLTKISPLIKKGSYVKKGEVIARVKNSLEFEVTYKDRAINPLQVINLR
ncbi:MULTISPECIES: murein hydrolase activator EnvC family protein [unclassified Lebetimonas]|uniref:murein hydrolase activator EnvC family protein n=1 Tax=unclassified Lebetimonas TaxID=2648158 RepID=UPI000464B110|nr:MULTISPECIES: M23 family metallopeptidase [unclassified Lebetimonas]